MNLDQARKLKNGQHIQVNNFGRWIDALFVHLTYMDVPFAYKAYAHHMGISNITLTMSSVYGTCNYFDLDDIRLPMGGNNNEIESTSTL